MTSGILPPLLVHVLFLPVVILLLKQWQSSKPTHTQDKRKEIHRWNNPTPPHIHSKSLGCYKIPSQYAALFRDLGQCWPLEIPHSPPPRLQGSLLQLQLIWNFCAGVSFCLAPQILFPACVSVYYYVTGSSLMKSGESGNSYIFFHACKLPQSKAYLLFIFIMLELCFWTIADI
jgi:hypothetical protein